MTQFADLDLSQKFFGLLIMGIALAVVWGLTCPLAKFAACALAWVDDKEHKGFSPMTVLVARLRGFKPDGDSDMYFVNGKGETMDKYDVVMPAVAAMVALPLVSYLSVKFYEVPMALALLYAIAHTARFARRHKKLFDEHVKDPEAHK